MNLTDHLENTFDLSYLERLEFPKTEIKTIGILGGGTAGYLTALALGKAHPDIQVTVVESSRIPVIGVGESTTTEIVPFLHGLLDIDPVEFFQQVKPTLKLGIQFEWGSRDEKSFNFNFYAGHQYESYYYEKSIANANWPSVLMTQNKLPVISDPEEGVASFLNTIPFSYHLENRRFVKFLNGEIKRRGMKILDAEVLTANLDSDGAVASLMALEEGASNTVELNYDLYIDCSGFRSKLLGEALKTEFIPFTDTLFTDRALTFDLPDNDVIDVYTSVLTMKSGWCWKIPTRGEDHYGYVFSTKYSSEEEALTEARARFGNIANPKFISFRSGRHAKAWNKNVLALGNAYAFIEPLESTAIQNLVHSVMLLCRIMPNSVKDESSIAGLNHEIAATWDTFRWFLGVHYKFNQQMDTAFWRDCREKVNIGDAKHILALFDERAPLSAGKFGTEAGYSAFEPLVFNSFSYDSILFGQKLVQKPLAKPKMTKAVYDSKVASYKALSTISLSQFDFLKDDLLFADGLLEELFEDPISWIRETGI